MNPFRVKGENVVRKNQKRETRISVKNDYLDVIWFSWVILTCSRLSCTCHMWHDICATLCNMYVLCGCLQSSARKNPFIFINQVPCNDQSLNPVDKFSLTLPVELVTLQVIFYYSYKLRKSMTINGHILVWLKKKIVSISFRITCKKKFSFSYHSCPFRILKKLTSISELHTI